MTTSDFQVPLSSQRYRWLPLSIILLTLVAFAVGVWLLHNVERRLVSAAGEELTVAAAEVSDKLDRLLFERRGDAQMLARAFSLRAFDPAYLNSYLGWMKTNYVPVYHWLGVMDGQGIMVASTEPALRGRNYSAADWFQRARATRRMVVQDVASHEADNGIETVAFTAPILDSEGTFLGAVTTRVTIPVLEDVTTRTVRSLEERQEFTGPVSYQMVTKDGAVFADSDLLRKSPQNVRQLGLPSISASESGEPGFVEEEYRGVPVVTGYAHTKGYGEFPGLGWYVLVRMDRDRILDPIRSILWKVGISGAVIWLPMLFLVFWSTSKLRKEYQQAQQESAWARAAEAALLQSQERNRAIVDTALDGLVSIDSGGVVTDWNGQAAAIFGWPREEALGRRLAELIIPQRDREAHERGLRHYLASGESHILNRRVEVLAMHRTGREFPVELSISPVRIGDTFFFSAFARDITERREAESKLKESEARYRSVVNALDEGVVVIDDQGAIRTGNASAERILGMSMAELTKRPLHDPSWRTIHEDGRPFPSEAYPATVTLRTGQSCSGVVMGFFKADGELRWLEVNSRPLRSKGDAAPSAVVVSFSDITKRKRAEERLTVQYSVTRALAESRTLEEAVPKIIQAVGQNLEWDCGVFWRVDKVGGVLRCIDQWQQPSASLESFATATWASALKPGEGLPGRIWASEKPAWVTDVTVDGNFPRSEQARAVGLHGAFGFPVRIGSEVEGVIELFSRQVRLPDDELLKMIDDIGLKIGQLGERTRTEEALRQTEAQLQQSQKMEAVGRLAGGVAHDFNNLLTVIRGYSELLLSRLQAGDSMRKDMEEVKKAADRASGLTRQLLAFSRRQFIAPKIVDLNALVVNMDGMLRRLMGEDIIDLCAELSPQVGAIRADPGQIEQVIMNLAVNARDAMPKGGRLTIETRNVTIGKSSRQDAIGLEPGSYVLLTVRDTGHGMDAETRSHLFEPFFTTKEKGKGTGLGLSTVYGIVKQSKGSIAVESVPGKGTAFKIYFPLISQEGPDTAGPLDTVDPAHGRETILLVEDEPAVRGLVHETLRLHGYTVLEARHGIEALMTVAKHTGPIHLLLTDVVMPQMSGPEVAEKLHSIRPETKVLYMSGYPDHPVFEHGGVSREASFLPKPFTPNVLAKKVREVLDGVKVA
ncbi:MAG: PAS domain S-box protein [Nitrospira sp. CR1.3]|nr:PAS domain S-box protein [Nitrospira sp. CR1.3]